jgi:hypothetical protein
MAYGTVVAEPTLEEARAVADAGRRGFQPYELLATVSKLVCHLRL